MMRIRPTVFNRFLKEESGQTLAALAFMLVAMIGMAGFSIDLGRLLYANRELQASTDAAALAGASVLPNSTAVTTATLYSSQSGKLNAHSNLPNVSFVSGYPKVLCLTSLKTQGMACSAPGNGNAIQVKQQVDLPLTFLKVLGLTKITLGASATASMRGSISAPYNVAIILDTTASMNSYDSDSNCGGTRLSCALSGVQTLLLSLSPCASTLKTCGTVTNANVTNPVDTVALYTFPGVTTTAQAQKDYDCSSSSPTISTYNYPALPVYQIVKFSSDYRTSDSVTTLATTSNLSKASNGVKSCTGMQAIGGVSTYYASAIYQAQADLIAQSNAHPGTQNVIILLSDGDANITTSNESGFNTKTATYPSIKNQCQQAIDAGKAAYNAGTEVYTVAYGAASSGCSTDSGLTPCTAMQGIASGPQYFFSDYTASQNSGNCISGSQPVSGLTQIFTQIANNMTVGRLIPDNTQ